MKKSTVGGEGGGGRGVSEKEKEKKREEEKKKGKQDPHAKPGHYGTNWTGTDDQPRRPTKK